MNGRRISSVTGFVLAAAILAFANSIASAAATIGIYTDEAGSSCSFAGNNSGQITAYVVVKPDASGLSAVRFSAPIPSCLGATLIAEYPPSGATAIGATATGISVGFLSCATEPSVALQIIYQRTSTDPCCEFPIVADPFVGIIEGTDCTFQPVTMNPVTSHFNADSSCPCAEGAPPYPPIDPNPFSGLVSVSPYTGLSWSHSPADFDIAEYDVYFGTVDPPPFAATVTQPSYQPATPLAEHTQHFWRVVVRDTEGLETSGPLWDFETGSANAPPYAPAQPTPFSGALNQLVTPTLKWTCNDPEGDPLEFDVYLGTTLTPPLVATVTVRSYTPATPLLFDSPYYWMIVARDTAGNETAGPQWEFTTRPEDYTPSPPYATNPLSGATGVRLWENLEWNCNDPEVSTFVFDLYFGDTSPPPLIRSNSTSKSYDPPSLLDPSTLYFWRVVARDPSGSEVSGPEWQFTTKANSPPYAPTAVFPPVNATNVPTDLTLQWNCSDPDGHALTYDVYLYPYGASQVLVASDIAEKSYPVSGLVLNQTYRWKITARDELGAEHAGAIWEFTTGNSSPPNTPNCVSPPNGVILASSPSALIWSCTDPNNLPLTYNLYYGGSPAAPLVAVGLTATSYPLGYIPYGNTRYWRVVAFNGQSSTAGALWSFSVGSGPLPVTFSSFNATPDGASARIEWELSSDEAIERYTIYRTAGTGLQPLAVTSASVTDTRGAYTDTQVEPGRTYSYEMVVRTAGGDEFRSQKARVEIPVLELTLGQNHPNPFNPQTSIPYTVPAGAPVHVRLVVYDASGRTVRVLVNTEQGAGSREVVWNGTDEAGATVSSGIYFCVLQAGKERRTQKMVLLK